MGSAEYRREYYRRHREEVLAANKRWRQAHPEYFEAKKQDEKAQAARREYAKRYRETHREELQALRHDWYMRHREEILAQRKAAYAAKKGGQDG